MAQTDLINEGLLADYHDKLMKTHVAGGCVFDISAYHATGTPPVLATYADLAAALGTNGANIPEPLRKGGMSVKFVQSSDNKYIQARCMAQDFTTDVTQWQGVDDIPTYNSPNIPSSKGTAELIAEESVIGKKKLSLTGTQYGYTTKNGYQLNADGTIEEKTGSSASKYRTIYTNNPVNKGAVLHFTGTSDRSARFAVGISSVPITDENITSVQLTTLLNKTFTGVMDVKLIVPFNGYIAYYRYTDYWTGLSQYVYNSNLLQDNSVLDVSEFNGGTSYANLTAALGGVPTPLQKGGMAIRYKEIVPATYNVVVSESDTQPEGTALSSASSVTDGTYTASQLGDFATLPTETGAGNAQVYYFEDSGTYTVWTITMATAETTEYKHYTLTSTEWSDAVCDWIGITSEMILDSSLHYGEFTFDKTDLVKKRILVNVWKSDYYCRLFPTQAGKRYRIISKSNNPTEYCFLTSDDMTSNMTPYFAEGYNNAIEIAAGKFVDVTASNNAKWLYVYAGNSNAHKMPRVILLDDISLHEINRLEGCILETITKKGNYNYGLNSDGTFGINDSYKHDAVPVNKGDIYVLRNTGSSNTVRYCFAESTNYEQGGDIPLLEDTVVQVVNSNTEVVIIVPENCYLLYNSVGYNSVLLRNRANKEVIPLATINSDGLMSKEDKSMLYDFTPIDLSVLTNNLYYIKSSGIWARSIERKNNCKLVPVVAGKDYMLSATVGRYYAWLKSDTIIEGESPDFCDGNPQRYYYYDNTVVTAPDDANYLYVVTYSKSVATNISVSVGTTLKDIVSELIPSNEPTKILLIGDSWARDAATELWSAANDMGINLVVGQAYQGGSGLYNQYKGMDDATRTYNHGSWVQYTQGTYQMWLYTKNSPTKTPSSSYHNGKCGVYDGTAWGKDENGNWAAKTLAECLASQDWDIILMRMNCGDLQSSTKLTTNDDNTGSIDISDFISRMEQELTPASLAKVKWGVFTCWSYPEEAALTYTPGQGILSTLGIADWNALTDAEKEAVYAQFYPNMQKNFQIVCKHLGNKLSYFANCARAIQLGRKSEWLKDVAWHMIRSSTDTHLGNGIPKYICALTLLYSIFDVDKNKLQLNYIPDLVDGSGDNSDGGNESNPTTPTKALCIGAREVAWNANGWGLTDDV